MRPDVQLSNYQYNLPDRLIAAYPLPMRDQSKLLVYTQGRIQDMYFYKLPELLPPDSLLVQNDTRVVPARLWFHSDHGAKIEIFCLYPDEADPGTALAQTRQTTWICLVGNKKRWRQEELTIPLPGGGLTVRYLEEVAGGHRIQFDWQPARLSFADVLDLVGRIPLPPYLQREADEKDRERYQTVFAEVEGSVAAPTASLHFTKGVLQAMDSKGLARTLLTLHVGAGTFLPVKSERIAEHDMHAETFTIRKQTLLRLIAHVGPIVATGTTTMRALESLCWLGTRLAHTQQAPTLLGQWEAYELEPLPPGEALTRLLHYMNEQGLEALTGQTRLLIAPGYRWQLCQGLVTNFHQPGSTLLLLVAAFVGEERWRMIYDYALAREYRFLSYGDASLLWR